MAFTALNDVSLEHLLPLIIEDERLIIRLIEASAVALPDDREANELATDIMVCETRHLQTLQRASDNRSFPSDMSARAERKRSAWPIDNSRPDRGKLFRPRRVLSVSQQV